MGQPCAGFSLLRCADHCSCLECPILYSKTRERDLQFPGNSCGKHRQVARSWESQWQVARSWGSQCRRSCALFIAFFAMSGRWAMIVAERGRSDAQRAVASVSTPQKPHRARPKIFPRRFAYNFLLPAHTVLISLQSGPRAAVHTRRVRVFGRNFPTSGTWSPVFSVPCSLGPLFPWPLHL